MQFAQRHGITDVCVLVEDIERSVAFYVGKLGFKLRRKAEGFADFSGAGLTLAAWEIDHIAKHCGVSNSRAPSGAHRACIALEVSSPDEVDAAYEELSAKGVPFASPPKDYMWNARCIYFTDPDDTLWEVYAWIGGGPDDYHDVHG